MPFRVYSATPPAPCYIGVRFFCLLLSTEWLKYRHSRNYPRLSSSLHRDPNNEKQLNPNVLQASYLRSPVLFVYCFVGDEIGWQAQCSTGGAFSSTKEAATREAARGSVVIQPSARACVSELHLCFPSLWADESRWFYLFSDCCTIPISDAHPALQISPFVKLHKGTWRERAERSQHFTRNFPGASTTSPVFQQPGTSTERAITCCVNPSGRNGKTWILQPPHRGAVLDGGYCRKGLGDPQVGCSKEAGLGLQQGNLSPWHRDGGPKPWHRNLLGAVAASFKWNICSNRAPLPHEKRFLAYFWIPIMKFWAYKFARWIWWNTEIKTKKEQVRRFDLVGLN